MAFSRIGLKRHEKNREDARSLAWESDWILHEICYPSDEIPWSRLWLTQDKQTSIQYVEEYLTDINYFIIEGKDREEILKYICDSLDVVDLDEIKRILQNESYCEENSQEYLDAVYNLGLIATPGKFDRELSHEFPEVRYAGIMAINFANWREFAEPLERIKNTDSHPDVRELAEQSLYAFSQVNWEEIEQV